MWYFINKVLFGKKNLLPPFDFSRNRFLARKQWPPNFKDLTEKQQFRFERKFKRRIKEKAISPTWNKWTKIIQWSLIGFVVVYGVLFHDFAKDPMNPRPGEQPFLGLRKRMWDFFDSIWTHNENTIVGKRGQRRVEPMSHPYMPESEDDGQNTSSRSP